MSFHSDHGNIIISPVAESHPTDGVGLAVGPISASLVANIASLHGGDRVGSSSCCRAG